MKRIAGQSSGMNVATFDTRVDMKFAKVFGFAADRLAKELTSNGAKVTVAPEGFIVKGRSGPLAAGEAERARAWAAQALCKQGT